MDEQRARELQAREKELMAKLGELFAEYVDVLRPGGLVARRWLTQAELMLKPDEDGLRDAVEDLVEMDESAYRGMEPTGWAVVVELGDMAHMLDKGVRVASQRFLAEASMPQSHVDALFLTATGLI